MTRESSQNIIMWLLGTITTIAIGLSSFTLYWVFNANATLKEMSSDINTFNELDKKVNFQELKFKIDAFLNNNEDNKRQDKQLSKHWKLHGWERDQINTLRTKDGLEIISWPDLPGEEE